MRRQAWTWCVVALGLQAAAFGGRASAFGDPFRFADPAANGGGGGRWFTGSPADGFGCEVCHVGDPSSSILVTGVPEKYLPGDTYSIAVSWPQTMLHVTALVELTDALGRGAGNSLVEQEGLSPAESCEPVEQGVPAGIVLAGPDVGLADGRQLVAMQDCGANMLHWSWTAPPIDVGPVMFSGGLVEPDRQRNAEGDRSARLFRVIAGPSGDGEVQVRGTCAALPARAGSAGRWSVFVALCALLARRSGSLHRLRRK